MFVLSNLSFHYCLSLLRQLTPLPDLVAPGTSLSDANQPSRADQFNVGTLHRSHLDPNPFTQFHNWFSDSRLLTAIPETCTLSTAHLPSGRVSSRMVYLKELDETGWVIYSNWDTSQKAADFKSNKWVSLCFWWKAVERQVRVEGRGERLSNEESQRYFDTRARGSRIGAWASRQSTVLRPRQETNANTEARAEGTKETAETEEHDDGRLELEEQVKDIKERFHGQEHIPVPEFWGGLRVVPEMVEFWQGRESRLHDRFRYQRTEKGKGDGGGEWKIERLSP